MCCRVFALNFKLKGRLLLAHRKKIASRFYELAGFSSKVVKKVYDTLTLYPKELTWHSCDLIYQLPGIHPLGYRTGL